MKLVHVLIFSWLMTIAVAYRPDAATLEPIISSIPVLSSIPAFAGLLGAAVAMHIIAAKSMTLIDAFSGDADDNQVVK